MYNFEIVSDSSHDLPVDYISENNIHSISFYVKLNTEEYIKDQIDITREEFYRQLRVDESIFPQTSQPSAYDFKETFTEIAKEGKDIICMTVASVLSGSNNSANLAATQVMEEFPDINIYVINSKSCSLGIGSMLIKAVDMRKEGKTVEECRDLLLEKADTSEIYIALDTLNYLEKGGRISKPGALAVSLLNIKPIVSLRENKLHIEGVSRGAKKSHDKIFKLLDSKVHSNPENYDITVIHGDIEDTAEKMKQRIEETYGIKLDLDVALVSPAVISHIGPRAMAICVSEKIK